MRCPDGFFDYGDPLMKIQNGFNQRPSLLTLFGLATIVLLVFAWTYVN